MKAQYKKLINAIATLVGISALIWFLSLISFNDLVQGIQQLSWSVIIITILLSFISYIFRAARFYHPLNKRIPLYDLTIISLIHTFTNTALPARAGEFSFLYYAKKYSGLPIGYLTSSLVFIRYIELFILATSFPLMLALIPTRHPVFDLLLYTSGALSITLILAFILACVYHQKLRQYLSRMTPRTRIGNLAHSFAQHFFDMIAENLKYPRHIAWSVFYTICVWYTAFLSTYILVKALGVPLNFAESTISGLFVILTGLLPISGFMGIGLWEGAWIAALTLQGVNHEVAITSGIVMHALRALLLVIFGGLGFLLSSLKKKPVVTHQSHDQPLS